MLRACQESREVILKTYNVCMESQTSGSKIRLSGTHDTMVIYPMRNDMVIYQHIPISQRFAKALSNVEHLAMDRDYIYSTIPEFWKFFMHDLESLKTVHIFGNGRQGKNMARNYNYPGEPGILGDASLGHCTDLQFRSVLPLFSPYANNGETINNLSVWDETWKLFFDQEYVRVYMRLPGDWGGGSLGGRDKVVWSYGFFIDDQTLF
jgi:hypothetical protein